jgi:thiol-disulfide isomerase/thioredoxin
MNFKWDIYTIVLIVIAIVLTGWLFYSLMILPRGNIRELFSNSTPKAPIVLTMYKTEWCGYSQKAKPMIQGYQKMMDENQEEPKVTIEIIDCDSETGKSRCSVAGIQGYPSYHLSVNGKPPVEVELRSEMTPEEVHQQLLRTMG